MNDLIKSDGQHGGQALGPPVGGDGFREGASPDIHDILGRLRKRLVLIVLVAVGVILPAAIATYLADHLYRSSSIVQVNPDSGHVVPYRDIADLVSGVSNNESLMRTQEQVLRGHTLRSRVAERLLSQVTDPEVQAETCCLGERLEVRRLEESQLFEIGYLAPAPETAAVMVNLFTEEYIKQHVEVRQKTRERAQELLRKELADLAPQLELSERDLVRYARANDMTDLDSAADNQVHQRLSILEQQAADTEAQLVGAKTQMESLERASTNKFPATLTTPLIDDRSATLLQLQHQLAALRTKFGENWPDVLQKRREIAMVQEQLAREKEVALARAREQARLDHQTALSKHTIMANSLARQKDLVDRFNDATVEYNILRREVETNQKLYENLLERMKETSVMEGTEFGNIHVIEPARPIPIVASPNILLNLGVATFLGLSLGICLALLIDFWDTTVSNLSEAEQLIALPGLGSVPYAKFLENDLNHKNGKGRTSRELPGAKTLQLTSGSDPSPGIDKHSENGDSRPPEVSEAIRDIVASILLSQSDKELRVICVTSANPEEGKTTVANEIGMALAENGAPTLLLEADLRKPELSHRLGVTDEGGLSLYLSSNVASPTVHETDREQLFLITSGPNAPNPFLLFNSEKMKDLLKDLSSSFRFVVIDSPPVVGLADSRVLAARADGVVLVVRANRTAAKLVRRAQTVLQKSGANVLGIVLNAVERQTMDLYYSYYYHRK